MSLPDEHELSQRLRAFAATSTQVGSRSIDFLDRRVVDSLSGRLVECLGASGSTAVVRDSAFSLLVETAVPLLDRFAAQVRRRIGLGMPSSDLVNAYFAEVYSDGLAPGAIAGSFLAAAEQRIESVAVEIAAVLAGHRVQSTAGAVIAGSLAGLLVGASDELERLGDELLDVYSQAFHSLDALDRRVLVCHAMDDLPEAETAAELGVSVLDVTSLFEQALARFTASKDALYEGEALAEMSSAGGHTSDLADLVYELLKASLARDATFARVIVPVEAPRDMESVRADLREKAELGGLTDAEISVTCRETEDASEDHALLVQSLFALLERLEPSSARKLLTEGHWLVGEGHHEAGCKAFERVLADSEELIVNRRTAAAGLGRSLTIRDEYSAVAQLRERAREVDASSVFLELLAVWNLVSAGAPDEAHRLLDDLRKGPVNLDSHERGPVRNAASYICTQLDIRVDEMEAILGFTL